MFGNKGHCNGSVRIDLASARFWLALLVLFMLSIHLCSNLATAGHEQQKSAGNEAFRRP